VEDAVRLAVAPDDLAGQRLDVDGGRDREQEVAIPDRGPPILRALLRLRVGQVADDLGGRVDHRLEVLDRDGPRLAVLVAERGRRPQDARGVGGAHVGSELAGDPPVRLLAHRAGSGSARAQ